MLDVAGLRIALSAWEMAVYADAVNSVRTLHITVSEASNHYHYLKFLDLHVALRR